MFKQIVKHQKKILLSVALFFFLSEKDNIVFGLQSFFWPSATTNKFSIENKKISYSYVIKNKKYHSEKILYGSGNNENRIMNYLNAIKNQKQINVYYHPEKPQKAVLIKGLSLQSILNTINAFIITILSIIIFTVKLYIKKILYGIMLLNYSAPKILSAGTNLLQGGCDITQISKLSLFSLPALYGIKMIKKSLKVIAKDSTFDSLRNKIKKNTGAESSEK